MKGLEWISLLKAGFKGRFSIAYAVVITTALYGLPLYPLARLTVLIVILLVGELFILTYVPRLLERGFLLITYKRNVSWQPIPKLLAKLANKMKVKIKRFGIKEGLYNAYYVKGTVIVGRELYQSSTKSELEGIFGHELGHAKLASKQSLKEFLYWFLVVLSLFSFSPTFAILPPVIACLATIAYLTIVMVPVMWWHELQADALAAKFVGVRRIRAALLKLAKGRNIYEHSETHPSIATRIKRLDRLTAETSGCAPGGL